MQPLRGPHNQSILNLILFFIIIISRWATQGYTLNECSGGLPRTEFAGNMWHPVCLFQIRKLNIFRSIHPENFVTKASPLSLSKSRPVFFDAAPGGRTLPTWINFGGFDM